MSDCQLTSKEVKCRKDYSCGWCGEHIAQGDPAQSRTGIHLGGFYSTHEHPECYRAMLIGDLDEDSGYVPHEQARGEAYA